MTRTADQLLDQFTSEALSPASGASPPSTPEDQRKWSPMQEDIFALCSGQPKTNLMIQARAGTGKTTTILKAMEHSPGSSLFLAFNKSIADELSTRVPADMARNVKTLNALGFAQWRSRRPQAQMEIGKDGQPPKLARLMRNRWGENSELIREYGYTMTRVVGLAKAQAYGLPGSAYPSLDSLDKWGGLPFAELIESYQMDIPADNLDEIAVMCKQLFLDSVQDLSTLDFDDQIYIPALAGWSYPAFSNAFVDEFQDLNPIQHFVCKKLIESGARLVGVGDDHQAIYGFRGALTNSMSRAQNEFGMTVLPLSVSYRCAQSVITEAQKYCPDIQWRPGAPEGRVWRMEERWKALDSPPPEDPEFWDDGTLVLCRNNAPLFKAILRCIRAKRPCRVLTNFLEGFQSFIRSFRCDTTDKLLAKLERWYERERSAAESKGFWGKVQGLGDRYATCKLLCEQYHSVQEVLGVVKSLGEGRSGPIFSTIHKAKGLEADRVYILGPDLLPAFYARTPEQLQQEYNLLYVAITRAREDLGFGVPQLRGDFNGN